MKNQALKLRGFLHVLTSFLETLHKGSFQVYKKDAKTQNSHLSPATNRSEKMKTLLLTLFCIPVSYLPGNSKENWSKNEKALGFEGKRGGVK